MQDVCRAAEHRVVRAKKGDPAQQNWPNDAASALDEHGSANTAWLPGRSGAGGLTSKRFDTRLLAIVEALR